ncbi:MAG TPA: hypothetical protein VNL16_12780 [Chloroflexota bacterium]|nr:hypothetical protein [Chloroflexota bacterium]
MTQLIDDAKTLHVRCESSDSGEWVRYPCPRGGTRYVVRSRLADGYIAWCEAQKPPAPEWYLTATEAIRRGL